MDWFDFFNQDTTASDVSPNYIGTEDIPRSFLYSDLGYSGTPDEVYSNEGRNYPTVESTQGPGGSPVNSSMATGFDRLLSNLKNIGGKAMDFAGSPQGISALLLAALAAATRRGSTGGGAAQGYQGPANISRTMAQGKYGPLVRYAAEGGLMQAYAQGGEVKPFPMQHGGFVMTKKAVDGAGGPEGIQQLVPGAKMIGGPADPTGKRDLTPAVIHGPNGKTPAKVSRGEAYVPPGHNTKGLYALMHSLERKA